MSWNAKVKKWVVAFVGEGQNNTIGFFEKGQDAVDLVNCLNGGQSVVATEEQRGKIGVTPQQSDEELMRQLSQEPVQPGGST
jgi:hypothetical protein